MSDTTVSQGRVRPLDEDADDTSPEDASTRDRATTRDDEPDPRLVWRWLGRAARPYLGWILLALGVIAIVLGYYGVSRQLLVAQQVPYLVSGGLLGISLVFLGGIAMLIDDLRDTAERLDTLERHTADRLDHVESLVGDLRRVLLAHPEAPQLSAGPRDLVSLPGGTSYHRPDCRVVQDKDVEPVTEDDLDELSACKLCEPDAA